MEGLPGYHEYASKVRFRLLPSVWWWAPSSRHQ